MLTNEEVQKIIYEQIKDLLKQKPLTKEEIHNNPMKKEEREPLYNAILCYDEQNNVCGYNIQVRLAKKEIYKLRFYLPIIDENWKNIRQPQDLPDKKIKVGFDGEFVSQNELLKKNDIEQGLAMYLNLKSPSVIRLGGGFVGLADSDALYNVVAGFKYAGYQTNEATKKENENKLFW